MKKLFAILLAVAMMATMSVTAFAANIEGESGTVEVTYGVSESYTVTIPAETTLTASGTSIEIAAPSVVIPYGKQLTVSISSSNYAESKWYLVDTANASNKLEYSIKNGDNDVTSGSAILTVAAGTTDEQKVTLKAKLVDTVTYSGIYKDTLTFTVAVKASPYSYDATTASANDLKTALTTALQAGKTDLDITLAADADKTMTTAIFEAITASAATDGSISLTLRGITTIAESAFYHYGEGEYSWDIEANTVRMKQVGALTLMDVTTVGESGFEGCNNLTSLTAPKLQTLGDYAFSDHKLSVIDLPEATKLGFAAFESTIATVTKVDLPKVTEIHAFALGALLAYADGAEVILTGLTEDFIFNNWYDTSTYTDFISTLQMENINLKLNSCMQGQVSGNTWTIPRESGDPILRTFKSITLEE